MGPGLGLNLLRLQLVNLDSLKYLSRNNIHFIVWSKLTTTLIEELLGQEHHLHVKFRELQYTPVSGIAANVNMSKFKVAYLSGLEAAAEVIKEVEHCLQCKAEYETIAHKSYDGDTIEFLWSIIADLETTANSTHNPELIKATKAIIEDLDAGQMGNDVFHNILAGQLNRLCSSFLGKGD
ncbi:hypothetical protein MFMK1_000243 [Metallumcola ferriviriculae]|uniref:Uncharacterized protein n=1 Tax=Metallumcola ferriviriculae TaxID=3039180 RepID=A0AAU0UK01_9FIRM|nr:hypothetical protein MFMK1_000243 [Desulfitibacteraceae bacterium MK1]